MMKILIIQTAFIGDVVLATALIEKIAEKYPQAEIDFLLRKGNESLLENNPNINKVLIFDKKNGKYKNLILLISKIRKNKYDKVINIQRFFTTGLLTVFSGAKETIGFDKNPFSFLFSKKVKHNYSKLGDKNILHEVQRNLELIETYTDSSIQMPKLYPSNLDFETVKQDKKYITLSPSSVWFTKKMPNHKWIELINKTNVEFNIFLLGAKSDMTLCEELIAKCDNNNVVSMAGKLSFLQSTALMKNAVMNYVNDSAPLHFASAVNAPVTAFFCSTILEFGFGPLSDKSFIGEYNKPLECKPCGLHGKKECPKINFLCGEIPLDNYIV